MTRAVTITNTSNWDGETVQVEFKKNGNPSDGNKVILKPGETISFPYLSGDQFTAVMLDVSDQNEQPTKPFYKDGRQILPSVETVWKYTNGDRVKYFQDDVEIAEKNIKERRNKARGERRAEKV